MLIGPEARRTRMPSLTPLIDVVFILLVFFMLVSQFTQYRAMAINVPPPASNAPSQATPLTVRVHADGRITVNEADVLLANLAEHVTDVRGGEPVFIQPVGDVALARVVAVMDSLAGLPDVSLAREN